MTKVSLILKTFTQETTMHALCHIANESRGKLRRLLWLLSFVCMVVLFLYILVQSSLRYSSYPVSTIVEYTRVQEMPFPSVTICNMNAVNETFRKEQNELTQKILANQPVDLSDDETIKLLREMDFEQLRLAASHTAEETFSSIMFDLQPITLPTEALEFRRTEMLFCHTIHPASYMNRHDPLMVKRAGQAGGFIITLNVHTELYAATSHKAMFSGMSLLVHDPNEEPDILVKGTTVRAGTTTNIVISKQQQTTLPHPYNSHVESCVDTNQTSFVNPLVHYKNYSYSACVTDCIIEYIREQCGCRIFLHNGPTVPPCSYEQSITCGFPAYSEFYVSSYVHQCECFRPCKETMYDMSVTSILSDDVIVKRAFPHLDQIQRSNLVHLNIYFTDIGYTQIRQERAYPIESFLAEVGGLFGLFIGASILTIVEMLELVVLVLAQLLCNRQNNQDKVKPLPENRE